MICKMKICHLQLLNVERANFNYIGIQNSYYETIMQLVIPESCFTKSDSRLRNLIMHYVMIGGLLNSSENNSYDYEDESE